jgi:CheY-like chemotaxis protein
MLRVLIIDDNKDAADTFALLVRIWGHECRRVYDGSEAVKISSAFRPDVVFLDLGMPKIDGFAVARQLRPQLLHTGAMLIAVTGYADREHRLLCEQAGFAQFLPKPVDPEIVGTLLLSEKNRRANAGQSRGYCTANYREQLP